MALQSRALAALPEMLNSVSSNYVVAHKPSVKESDALFWHAGTHAYTHAEQSYLKSKETNTQNLKIGHLKYMQALWCSRVCPWSQTWLGGWRRGRGRGRGITPSSWQAELCDDSLSQSQTAKSSKNMNLEMEPGPCAG